MKLGRQLNRDMVNEQPGIDPEREIARIDEQMKYMARMKADLQAGLPQKLDPTIEALIRATDAAGYLRGRNQTLEAHNSDLLDINTKLLEENKELEDDNGQLQERRNAACDARDKAEAKLKRLKTKKPAKRKVE